MKGGKKRNTISDPVQPSPTPPPPPPPLPPSDLPTTAPSLEDGGDEERLRNSEESGRREDAEEAVEEDEGDEEDSEADKEYEQDDSVQIEKAEGERTKLADGYYEIESVRRKRVRKVNYCCHFY